MHLKTINGKVSEVHLEDWDIDTLNEAQLSLLKELEGENELLAINVLFCERYFIYLKHCFILRDGQSSLYLWCQSKLDPDALPNLLTVTKAKVATFVRKSFETEEDDVFVVFEEALVRFGLEHETVPVSIDEDCLNKSDNSAIDLFGLFGITRNGKNVVTVLNTVSGNTAHTTYTKNSTVVYRSHSGSIRVKQPVYLLEMSDDELRKEVVSILYFKEEKGGENLLVLINRTERLFSKPADIMDEVKAAEEVVKTERERKSSQDKGLVSNVNLPEITAKTSFFIRVKEAVQTGLFYLLIVGGIIFIFVLLNKLGFGSYDYSDKDAYIEPRAVDDYRI